MVLTQDEACVFAFNCSHPLWERTLVSTRSRFKALLLRAWVTGVTIHLVLAASLHAGQLGWLSPRVGFNTWGPMGFCVSGRLAWCVVHCFFSLCSFGVKLMDFQAHRRGGTLNRKHVSPAFQPPLPPTDGSTLAPAGPEPPPQSSRAESSTGGGTGPSSAGILEQGPSPGDSR